MAKLTKQQKLTVLVSGLAVIVLVAIAVWPQSSPQDEQPPAEQPQVEQPVADEAGISISNISEYNEGKPQNDEWLGKVEVELLKRVRSNSGNPETIEVTDAVVRKDSYTQNYNSSTDINTVDFIIDIPSLKQSYKAHYEWSGTTYLDTNGDPNRGMELIRCLPSNQLIYGNFSCLDAITEQYGWPRYDDILEHLPYKTSSYYIYPGRAESNKPLLVVHLNTVKTDSALVTRYRNQSLNQIRSWGFNPDDYNVNIEYDG